ncbi:MAG: 50S ribosomal protein L6 [archaeon]
MAKKDYIEKLEIPSGVKATLENNLLILKGAKGEVARDFNNPKVKIELNNNEVVLTLLNGSKYSKAIIKSYRAHILNNIKGCQEGFSYTLKICSGHFPMNVAVTNNKLVIKNFLGEKVPREVKMKQKVNVKVEGSNIYIDSVDKELAGQMSADIEQATRRPGFDRRIFQDGIYQVEKTGRK